MLALVLIILAVICLVLAAAGVRTPVHLGWLGVALFVTATQLVPRM